MRGTINDVDSYLETMRLLPNPQGNVEKRRSDGEGSESREKLSQLIVLASTCLMYSVHNLIAPNMTAMAKVFHFNAYERDTYLGGELTLFFYFPGVFGALLAGVLSGLFERRLLLAGLALVTSLSCLITAGISSFRALAYARATSGFAIGGSLPVVYSLVGDWFPAGKRASATAFVTAASGAGVFMGQCVATFIGSTDWHLPFLVVALPTAASAAAILQWFEEPRRGAQEGGTVETQSLYQHGGLGQLFSVRTLRLLMKNKTNLLVMIQAFPGNIPWGFIVVYFHDFLMQDLAVSSSNALGAITILAASAFAGVILGGFIGEYLYKTNSRHLAVFGGVCNIARAVPFFVIFGWKIFFGPPEKTYESTFFVVLVFGGFVATMGSPCTGAMLLNVNLPETRGSVMALYSVLDDVSKGFGTLFVSMLVSFVGGRAVAYQISLLLWVLTGVALLYTLHTYEEDEQQMRKHLDEAAMESMLLHSRLRAQAAIRDRAKAAGEAHLAHAKATGPGRHEVRWPAAWTNSQGARPWPATKSDLPAAEWSASQDLEGLGSSQAGGWPSSRTVASGVGRSCFERERLQSLAREAAAAAAAGAGTGKQRR
eukprot:TRINITY_DN32200_c0_g1_i1.p1 TRINITY_DN32200_c0_g1~~TRINITY_DN32200_c0_g1_i1.p1  ORF type:complete len:598 (-),score=134.05 TRINITY_DN32200_c0_g1_i1:221-2014(-)